MGLELPTLVCRAVAAWHLGVQHPALHLAELALCARKRIVLPPRLASSSTRPPCACGRFARSLSAIR